MIDRANEPWMQDLLVVCDEIRGDDLAIFRERTSQHPSCFTCAELPAFIAGIQPAVAGPPEPQAEAPVEARLAVAGAHMKEPESPCDRDMMIKALEWTTGLKELAVLEGLRASLPASVQQEQLDLYNDRQIVPKNTNPDKIVCSPHCLLKMEAVARAFDEHARSCGLDATMRLPKNFLREFLEEKVIFTGRKLKDTHRSVREWIKKWCNDGKRGSGKDAWTKKNCVAVTARGKRVRRDGGGRPSHAPMIHEQLFEWFIAMRYSIDWKALDQQRSRGGRKVLGRFPRRLLLAKLHELMEAYCYECIINGVKPQVFNPDSKWWMRFEADTGLSLRCPNRKYKCPKFILEERLELWWITLFRIRALCVALFGYDPEMENWDQSPFHNNESGSQNLRTLAFKGASTVPLIEGHADTRSRWTGNFTTFSNEERIKAGEIPYCQCCFKADGEVLQGRLQEHLRSRGYDSWFTVITTPKGSYREADVLNFLDLYLPKMTPGRRWRIIMADDFRPHKSPNAFRLCWSRGYVLVVHGGGTTPVAQTPDTDENQHVKREYSAVETLELMRQFRDTAVAVPRVNEQTALDMMYDIMQKKEMHLRAAKGYKYTGATIDLDGGEDHMVCREAGQFWNELQMRQKVNAEIALVRQEARGGRG